VAVRRPLVAVGGGLTELPTTDGIPGGPPSEGANAVRFLARLKADLANVSWLVVGDSTGDATDEWVYLAATALGAQFPSYTVTYHRWDPTGGTAYDTGTAGTPTTIQTGSGSNALHVWNCSVSGQGTNYVRGSRWAAAVQATNPDYITVSYGHNEGTSAAGGTTDGWRTQMLALTESLAAEFPVAELALTLQNPRDDNTDQDLRARAYRDIAELRGYGLINVLSVFRAQASLSGLIQGDHIHPTTGSNSGTSLWVAEVGRCLTWSQEARPRSQGPSLLTTPAPSLLRNGDFAEFATSPPTGWTATNCTPAQDTRSGWFETANGYSVRLQASSAAQTFIYQDIPAGLLPSVLGRYVTVAARLRVASGQPTTAGRVQVADSVSSFAATSSADLRDGWHWGIATKVIDPSATFARVRIYADTGTSSSADISVSEVHLVVGPVPRSSIPVRSTLPQPLDSDLTTIAGLTATTDNFMVAASSAWASRTPAQAKTSLALDNVDNTSNATERAATRTLTNARITKRVGTTTSTATLTVDSDSYDGYTLTAQAAALSIANPTGTPTEMQALMLRIKHNGTARAITWSGSEWRAVGVTLPTTTVISKTLYVLAVRNVTDSKWDVLATGQEA
jgi:hypothetical protein